MSSKIVALAFALFAAFAAIAAQAQPANSSPGTTVSQVSSSAGKLSPGVPKVQSSVSSPSSSASIGNASSGSVDSRIVLAAASTTAGAQFFGLDRTSNEAPLAVEQDNRDIWIYVLIGGFLILTMSQRRVSSMID